MKAIKKYISCDLFKIILGTVVFIFAFVIEKLVQSSEMLIFSTVLYITALVILGIGVFIDAVKGILRRDLLDEKFLMSVASIGAMIIGDMHEGVSVMLFFLIGEYFEHKAVNKSRKSIRSLMEISPDEVTVFENGAEEVQDADGVEPGTTIIVKTGERVAIDSVVESGKAYVDTSAITGESLPRAVEAGDSVVSGSVVVDGILICTTVKRAEESAAARILELVENASENKSKEENFITVFSRFYTPVVVTLALLMAVLPPLFVRSVSWNESIYRALTFLVISCPCALVISVPMAFFGGIGGAASKGILFKGGNTFSALASSDSFVFDKTGTLTSGEFSVSEIKCYDISEEKLLYFAASAEYGSTHPIAESVKKCLKNAKMPEEYHEVAGRGVYAMVDDHRIMVGNLQMLEENGIAVSASEKTALFVAVDGRLAGEFMIRDTVRVGVKESFAELKRIGAKRLVVLSGDRAANVSEVANSLDIDEYYADLLPEQKYENLEKIIAGSRATAYVGDGINDAPSLARADVGVAMGGIGSDSAIEAADVVIMNDRIEKLVTAVKISRRTIRIAKWNIAFALFVKLLVLILSAIGIANMWLAVFADVGVAVIAILNAMRALKVRE